MSIRDMLREAINLLTETVNYDEGDYREEIAEWEAELASTITITWSVADVKSIRPDLTDAQAMQVLAEVKHAHDCNNGITWEHIENQADRLFQGAQI